MKEQDTVGRCWYYSNFIEAVNPKRLKCKPIDFSQLLAYSLKSLGGNISAQVLQSDRRYIAAANAKKMMRKVYWMNRFWKNLRKNLYSLGDFLLLHKIKNVRL